MHRTCVVNKYGPSKLDCAKFRIFYLISCAVKNKETGKERQFNSRWNVINEIKVHFVSLPPIIHCCDAKIY